MGEKLSKKEKLGYGLTGFALSLWVTFLGTYMQYFYLKVAMIRPAVTGLIMSTVMIWDAINDPLIASFADNRRFKNGDRMRPYLIWSSIPLAICLFLTFTVFGSGSVTVIMAFVTYFIFRVPSTFYSLQISAMRQLATPDNLERVSLNTISSGWGAVAIASVSTVLWALIRMVAGVDAEGNMINAQRGFWFGAVVVGIIVIGTSLYNYYTTKERVQPEKEEKTAFMEACRVILKNRSFRQNLLLNFFYGTITTVTTGYALIYCEDVLGKPDLVIWVSGMYIVGVLISLPFVSKVYKKLGRGRMMAISALVLLAGGIVFIIFSKAVFSGFVLCLSIGIGTEFMTVMLAINKADITDIIEKTDGSRLDGMIGNVSNFFQKLASAALTAILGVALEWAHYDAELASQPESAMRAIILIMGLGSIISAAAMWLLSKNCSLDEELKAAGIER